MRRDEKSLIMVKPKFGYDYEPYKDSVLIPDGFDRDLFRQRRAFFEVHLVDWIVKHDLLGEGSIIKTINKRGSGYDRPEKYDEIGFKIKVL